LLRSLGEISRKSVVTLTMCVGSGLAPLDLEALGYRIYGELVGPAAMKQDGTSGGGGVDAAAREGRRGVCGGVGGWERECGGVGGRRGGGDEASPRHAPTDRRKRNHTTQ
jgi:hypothetical protein